MTDNERRINRAATIAAIVILSTALVAAGVGLIALWHDVQTNRARIDELSAQVVDLGGIPGQTVIVNPAPAAPTTATSTTPTTASPATPRSSTAPTPPTSESKISSAPPTNTPAPSTSAPPSTTTTRPPTPPSTAPLVCIVRPPVTVC